MPRRLRRYRLRLVAGGVLVLVAFGAAAALVASPGRLRALGDSALSWWAGERPRREAAAPHAPASPAGVAAGEGSISRDPAPISHDPAPISHDPAPISHDPAPISHDPAPVSRSDSAESLNLAALRGRLEALEERAPVVALARATLGAPNPAAATAPATALARATAPAAPARPGEALPSRRFGAGPAGEAAPGVLGRIDRRSLARMLGEGSLADEQHALEILRQLPERHAAEVIERMSRLYPLRAARLLRALTQEDRQNP